MTKRDRLKAVAGVLMIMGALALTAFTQVSVRLLPEKRSEYTARSEAQAADADMAELLTLLNGN